MHTAELLSMLWINFLYCTAENTTVVHTITTHKSSLETHKLLGATGGFATHETIGVLASSIAATLSQ